MGFGLRAGAAGGVLPVTANSCHARDAERARRERAERKRHERQKRLVEQRATAGDPTMAGKNFTHGWPIQRPAGQPVEAVAATPEPHRAFRLRLPG